MMEKGLAVMGQGGHGRVVADCGALLGFGRIEFFDDAGAQGFDALLERVEEFSACAVALGSNKHRLSLLTQLQSRGARLIPLVHPRATISSSAALGDGCFVAAGAVVGPDARIGAGCILNTGCTVDHDCILGQAVHISPGANLAGGVQVGDCAWIGIGAAVREMTRIGAHGVVGAGAAAISDVAEGQTVLGVPARPATAREA